MMGGARFCPGQRWTSLAEPELGLGLLLEADRRQLTIYFPSAEETRVYAAESAPVERMVFGVGDVVVSSARGRFRVVGVEVRDGLCFYGDGSGWVSEADLADTVDLATADRRLLDGRVDEEEVVRLRRDALGYRATMARHPARGLVGPKCDLLPHQLDVVGQVADRRRPRALLSDEVGLGKTIEAGWILHRRQVLGRAGRVLLLVPEALVHQWFIELYRRFNLTCALYDEARCAAAGEEPFAAAHLILAPWSLLVENRARLEQALAVDWGMVVVDEAHHLRWSPDPDKVSPEYRVVEALARVSPGLLLLTGTPEQFGAEGHFARLRLLDPERFSSWEVFAEQTARYGELAEDLVPLIRGERVGKKGRERVVRWLVDRKDVSELLPPPGARGEAWEPVIADLLDRHGTGRVVFRNTRATVGGFPRRKVHPAPLEGRDGERDWAAVAAGELAEAMGHGEGRAEKLSPRDPRVVWLARLLKRRGEEKMLVICRTRRMVEGLVDALAAHSAVAVATFHEELTLLQRDRNAAAFARPPPDGARVLICSEIGSEGRNFQWAHHLVLFDLPLDPELLEQRIGRLDRIGQRETIHLHVPYFRGTGGEVLFRWYEEGVGAFAEPVVGGSVLWERFGERVRELLVDPEAGALEVLIRETAEERKRLRREWEGGRDRLLEWSSCRPERVAKVVEAIRELDEARDLDGFLLEAFEHFGVQVEKLGEREGPGGSGERNWLLKPGHLKAEALAGIPPEGRMVTLDRRVALDRDDLDFLTWDHPLVISLMDLLLSSEAGNAGFVEVKVGLEAGLYADWVYVVEASAPTRMAPGRFLPPTPVRVVVDGGGGVLGGDAVAVLDGKMAEDVPRRVLAGQGELLRPMLERWRAAAWEAAERQAAEVRQAAVATVERELGREMERLRALGAGDADAEMRCLAEERTTLVRAVAESALRLDSVRLVRVVR